MSDERFSPASTPQQLRIDDFEIVSASPGSALAGIVSRMTGYREFRHGHYRQREAASLVVPLVISFGDPFAIGLGREPAHKDGQLSFAAGLFAGPVVIDSFGASHCVQIDFTPAGARRFFRMPMDELADRMVSLDDVLGREGRSLRERLLNETRWDARFDLARRFVERRVSDAPLLAPQTIEAYGQIRNSGGRMAIARVAEKVGWSRKHLSHRFHADFGLGPKAVARIVRFSRAVALGKSSTAGWADIAADCGYADQAHLTREFQALSGAPPTSQPA